MHNEVMNYHVQCFLIYISVFLDLQHFERVTEAEKSGGIFRPTPLPFGDVIQSQCFRIQLLIASATIFSHNLRWPNTVLVRALVDAI